MQVRRAALAAWLLLGAGIPAWAVDPMTLDDAFDRVAQAHPDLRLVQARTAVLAAEHEGANQHPPWTLGAEVENALSTGDARGLDSAEFTVSLSSVLERGGKLDARRALAQSRIDTLAVQREAQRENFDNFLLMHAMGANAAGQVASVVAGGVLLALMGTA